MPVNIDFSDYILCEKDINFMAWASPSWIQLRGIYKFNAVMLSE